MVKSRTFAIWHTCMATFGESLDIAARDTFCSLAFQGIGAGLLFTGLTATTGAGALGGLLVAGLSAAAYASLCNNPLPPSAFGDVPFDGGQCVDIPYNVTVTVQLILSPLGANVNVGPVGDSFTAIGPITLIEVFDTGPRDNDIRIRAAWKGGSRNGSFVKGVNDDEDNPQWGWRDPVILVERADGLPDICGNPPPRPPTPPPGTPPGGNIVPTDITYVNNEGDTIIAPVILTFGLARVDVRGELTIPVNFVFDADPTFTFNGNLNFNTGDFGINFGDPAVPPGGGDDGGDVVPDPTIPPPPLEIPPYDPPPPTEDPKVDSRRIIKACIVTVSQVDVEATQIFQDDNPDIYVPSLGYVQFLIKAGRSSGWTADIPVKNLREFIPCPWPLGAVDVRGTPRGTAQFTVTPIYTVSSFNPTFPPEEIG